MLKNNGKTASIEIGCMISKLPSGNSKGQLYIWYNKYNIQFESIP